jgi:hypothetical protein
MSDYLDHVYDESFNDNMSEFGVYVYQETAGLIAGAVVGIAALIACIVALIKRIFFKKDDPNSIVSVLSRIYTMTQGGYNRELTPEWVWVKGKIDIKAFGEGLQNVKDILNMMNEWIVVLNDKRLSDEMMQKIHYRMGYAKINFGKTYVAGNKWERSEDREMIHESCKEYKEIAKEIAKETKALSKKNDKLRADSHKTNQPTTKTDFTKFYNELLQILNTAHAQISKVSKNISRLDHTGM